MDLRLTLDALFPESPVDVRSAAPAAFEAIVDRHNTAPQSCDIIINMVEKADATMAERTHYIVRTSDCVLKLVMASVSTDPTKALIEGEVVVVTRDTPTPEIDSAVTRELVKMEQTWARGQLVGASYRSPVLAD